MKVNKQQRRAKRLLRRRDVHNTYHPTKGRRRVTASWSHVKILSGFHIHDDATRIMMPFIYAKYGAA